MKRLMRIAMINIIMCLVPLGLLGGSLGIKLDESQRMQRAELVGNKTANLEELVKVTEALNQQFKGRVRRFAVPALLGITDREIREYLSSTTVDNKSVMDSINALWQEFKNKQSQESSVLTQEAKEVLAQIAALINNAFSVDPFKLFAPERQTRLDTFINDARSRDQLLMVRSTGREDSIEFANAGGNESKAAIKPSIEDISKAIGAVVASYFGERSFNQRLLSLHKADIFAEPFLPVLLQVMIGERPGKDDEVPVSGVMFSQEAEGRTPGVVSISSTWGHAEGVVNGLVPVDQFFIGPTGTIHGLTSIKSERMKADENYQLMPFKNRYKIQKIPSLNVADINDLVLAARELEFYYAHPQDIEFVIDNNIIYLVQARPIVSLLLEPSYVKDDYIASLDADNIKSLYVIGAGGGSVQIIEKKENLIVADTINRALSIFLDHKDKSEVKAVIIGKLAPSTSHEATNFRGAGKPVFYVDNLTAIGNLVNTQLPLLIDSQRACMMPFIKNDGWAMPTDALEINSWLVHPIAKKSSIIPMFNIPTLVKIQEDATHQIPAIESSSGITTSKLLAQLALVQTDQEVQAIVSSLHARLVNKIIQEKKRQESLKQAGMQTNSALVTQLGKLYYQFLASAHEILATERVATPAGRISWLYPQVFLEALIRQIPDAQNFVDDYSMASLIKLERDEENLVKQYSLKGLKHRPFYVQMAKAQRYALVPEVNELWKQFINEMQSLDEEVQAQLITFFALTESLEIMPLWLNISFVNAKKSTSNITETAQILLQEFRDSKMALTQAQDIMDRLKRFSVEQFDNPESFTKAWRALQESMIRYFMTDTFNDMYIHAGQLGQFALLMTMNKLVEIFDTSIKALEASRNYADPVLQARRFKEMLLVYFKLLRQISAMPHIQNRLNAMFDERFVGFDTLNSYLDNIGRLLLALEPLESQLARSRDFNVAGAAMGSMANWGRSIGSDESVTLDDTFTLIHQNLLVTIGALFEAAGIRKIPLPAFVMEIDNAMRSLSFTVGITTRASSCIGVNIEKDMSGYSIIYNYNLPIRNHSVTFSLRYTPNAQSVVIETRFIGQARSRWEKIADWIVLYALLANLSFAHWPEFDQDKGLLTFSFILKNSTGIKNLAKLFGQLAFLTTLPDALFPVKLNFSEIANILALGDEKEYIRSIVPKIGTMIKDSPSLFMLLPELLRIVPVDHQAIEVIVNEFPKIVRTAPREVRSRLLPFLLNYEKTHLFALNKFFAYYAPQLFKIVNELLEIGESGLDVESVEYLMGKLVPHFYYDQFSHYEFLRDIWLNASSQSVECQRVALLISWVLVSTQRLPALAEKKLIAIIVDNIQQWIQPENIMLHKRVSGLLIWLIKKGYDDIDIVMKVIKQGLRDDNDVIKAKTFELLDTVLRYGLIKGEQNSHDANDLLNLLKKTDNTVLYEKLSTLINSFDEGFLKIGDAYKGLIDGIDMHDEQLISDNLNVLKKLCYTYDVRLDDNAVAILISITNTHGLEEVALNAYDLLVDLLISDRLSRQGKSQASLFLIDLLKKRLLKGIDIDLYVLEKVLVREKSPLDDSMLKALLGRGSGLGIQASEIINFLRAMLANNLLNVGPESLVAYSEFLLQKFQFASSYNIENISSDIEDVLARLEVIPNQLFNKLKRYSLSMNQGVHYIRQILLELSRNKKLTDEQQVQIKDAYAQKRQ